jgi:superfamily I DNA/RNA helicase
MGASHFLAIDGAPGTGKTRTIVDKAKDWGPSTAVITYTNDAAHVLTSRAPDLVAGTVYSLTWSAVAPYATTKVRSSNKTAPYNQRKIDSILDTALNEYINDAPSRPGTTDSNDVDKLARQLHCWREGPPPFDLDTTEPVGPLKYIMPLARWVAAGCPIHFTDQVDTLVIDECQDMSWLELRAALGLLLPGGRVEAYGDPGQSIFAFSKGMADDELPPCWLMADEKVVLDKGWRVGDQVASVASRVLSSYYERPASSFRADHSTQLLNWQPDTPPPKGLVMGYSRYSVAGTFKRWRLNGVGIVPKVGKADDELVLSTGHAAKGAEADDVYLLPWSRVALERLERRDTQTLRLLYVMMTRAKRRLYLPASLTARLPK